MIIFRQFNFSAKNKILLLNRKMSNVIKNSFTKNSRENVKAGVKNAVNNLRNEVNSFSIDPGESVARLGSVLSSKPVLAVAAPVPIPGTGILLDTGLKKVSPSYTKLSKRSKELYDKKTRKHVKTAAGAFSNYVNLYYT